MVNGHGNLLLSGIKEALRPHDQHVGMDVVSHHPCQNLTCFLRLPMADEGLTKHDLEGSRIGGLLEDQLGICEGFVIFLG